MVVPSRHQSACGVQSVVEQKLPEDGSVYLCLSPCDGCKDPERVMMWLTENIQACLRDFQTGTASMARKRHLASTARGLFGFCLMAQIGVQEVQGVQKVQIRSIRLIRGRERRTCSAAYCPPGRDFVGAIYTEGVAPGYSK